MLSSVIVVLGVYFLSGLALDLLPSIVYPTVRANVNNRGVAPEVLEETVAKPIENSLATTENLERIETDIQEGRVGVNLHFRYGTNIDFALQDASKNMERVRSQLPIEADPPTMFKFDPSQAPIYEMVFSSNAMSLVELRDWVENRLRPQLLTIEGVASIDISGGLVREIQVILDQERLRSYSLTVSQVIDGIRSTNQDIAAGRVSSPVREVVGKTEGKFQSVDEIRGMVLNVPGGRVPLTEVAEVLDTHREQRLWARLDGVPAVRVNVRKQPDANTVNVADQVKGRLADLRASSFIPSSVQFVVLQDQADFIRNSVSSVRNAALSGAGLAMLVVLLFLGSLRKTFIIGLAIPLAMLATFVMMGLGNLTLNIMSLGGLALGVGLLIDNSIVMLENIFRHREEGEEDPEEAAHEGAAEVTSAVVASTSTNLAAVIPFMLISGLAALLFRELILTISFAIIASLAVALTLVPMLSAQVAKIRFRSRLDERGPLVAFDHGLDKVRRGYRRVARRTNVRWRWAVLGTAVSMLVGSFFLTRGLGNEFLPQVDDGNVSVNINLPPGSSVDRTNTLAEEVEQITRTMPYIRNVFTTAGGQVFGGSTAETSGRGNLTIVLEPAVNRDMTANEWVQQLQIKLDDRGFPGARINVQPPRLRGLRTSRAGADVAITILGDDLAELRRISDEIIQRITGIPGLENPRPSTDEASPLLSIELDRERASYLGLNVATVGQTLRTAMDGTIATRYTEGNREYDVRVMFPRGRFQSPEDIGSIALFPGGSGGAPVYVRDVATVTSKLGPNSIQRENQNRIMRVTADVVTDEASIGEVNGEIRGRLADLNVPDGYGLIYGGEEEAIRENNRQLAIVVGLAIFLVFVVLAVQYESFVNPFVIILTIPLSLIGVGFALWITATPMSAPVLLGVVLLAGIVVNNAILLVDFVQHMRRDRGMSMELAVVEAGAVRLRPILMTTATTVCGMFPLALGIGSGTELMQPLAIAVVGGLLFSTFLTLFVVPSAYIIFNRGSEAFMAFMTGRRSSLAADARPIEAGAGD
jgi:hydrophobe/amphiphile efflux-1 (HAE1) family protein